MKDRAEFFKIVSYVLRTLYFLSGFFAAFFLLLFLYGLFSTNIFDSYFLSFISIGVICVLATGGLAYLEYRIRLYQSVGVFRLSDVDKKIESAFYDALAPLTDSVYKNKVTNEFCSVSNRLKKIEVVQSILVHVDETAKKQTDLVQQQSEEVQA